MLKKSVLVFSLLILMLSLNAIYVEIGSGDEVQNYVPAYGIYNYGWSRILLTNEEIGDNEINISQIALNVNNEIEDYVFDNQTVYFRNTTETTLPTEYIDPSDNDNYTEVYSGSISYSYGWTNIVFDQDFTYDGESNIEIVYINNDGSYASHYPTFVSSLYGSTNDEVIYAYNDNSLTVATPHAFVKKPNIRLFYSQDGAPGLPVVVAPLNNTDDFSINGTLNWTFGENTDWVNLYLGTDRNNLELVSEELTETSYTVSNLEYLTNYYWYLEAGNDATNYTFTSSINKFITETEPGYQIIGNGNEINTSLPVAPYYKKSYAQTIYLADDFDISDNQRIESISWHFNGATAIEIDECKVWLGTTTDNSFASSSWYPIADLDLVFDGSLEMDAIDRWIKIDLQSPFAYDGNSNFVLAVLAVSNTCGTSNDEFFCTPTDDNMSLLYKNDTNIPDPTDPPNGTLVDSFPNTLFGIGDIPTTASLLVSPQRYDFNDQIIQTSSENITISLRNTGVATMNINSIALDDDSVFSLDLGDTSLPLELNSNVITFDVAFNPQTPGDYSANVVITDDLRNTTNVPLTGTGYNATITEFPYMNTFEDSSEMPQDWQGYIVDNTAGSVSIRTYGAFEGSKCLGFNSGSGTGTEMRIVTPPIEDITSKRVRLMAKCGTTVINMIVGTVSNQDESAQFHEIGTVELTPNYQQKIVNFDSVTEGDMIAFKAVSTASYQTIYMDNVVVESIPSGPICEVTPTSTIDFEDVYQNRIGRASISISNWGFGDLECTFADNDLYSFSPETVTVAATETETIQVLFTPNESVNIGAYTGSFTVNSNDTSNASIEVNTQANILAPLPDGLVIIGDGSLTGQSLPMDPYYRHSYSQSIYLASEIGLSNKRITDISWFYNEDESFGPDTYKIYMGHTEENEFTSVTDWIPIEDLQLVYDGEISVTDSESEIAFELDIPFNYDINKNLVVAVFSSSPNYHGDDSEFYCTSTTDNRSIKYTNDSTICDPESDWSANGILKSSIPNVHLQLEDVPAGVDLHVNPESIVFPNTIMQTDSAAENITIINNAMDTATIANVSLSDESNFSVELSQTLPYTLQNSSLNISAKFTPQSEADFTANITIEFNENIDDIVIPLSGHGYDAIIHDFPYLNTFDEETASVIPTDWAMDTDIDGTSSSVTVYSSYGLNNSQSLKIYRGNGDGTYVAAITRPAESLTNRRVRFYAKSSTTNGSNISIGTCNSQNVDIVYSECDNMVITNEMTQHIVNLDANDTDLFVYIKNTSSSTYNGVYVDNFIIEDIPEGPSISCLNSSLNFNSIPLGRSGVTNLVIENWGVGELTGNLNNNDAIFAFQPETFTVAEGGRQIITVTMTPANDTALGEFNSSFNVNTNDTVNPIFNVECTAEIIASIDDDVAIIGTGDAVNMRIPMEPFYKHSWTQSLYYANEISIFDQRIESIAWQFNQNATWGPDELKMFVYETDQVELNEWIPTNDLTMVYDGTINTADADGDGWIELDLNTPYVYTGEHNLVIATWHSTPSCHTNDDEFFATLTTGVDRSIEHHSDTLFDYNNPTTNTVKQAIPNIMMSFGTIPNAPELTVTPDAIDFGTIDIDTESSVMNVTMLSTGLQAVIINDAPVLGGTNADQFALVDTNTYPLTISAGETATIGVKFTPSEAEAQSATLTINDNATRESFAKTTRTAHVVNLNGFAYEVDNNETPQTATNITLPLDNYPAAIDPVGDIDWYKMSALGVGDSLCIYTTKPNDSSIDPKAWLYGPCATADEAASAEAIASNDDSNGDHQPKIDHTVTAAGDYYLRIAYYSNHPANALLRKAVPGEETRDERATTGLYNLFVDAEFAYEYNAPLNLQANNFGGFVQLSWEEPPYERALASYDVYRNDTKITETPIAIGTESYSDTDVVQGTEYNYYVVANYTSPDGVSAHSNTVTITYMNPGDAIFGDSFEDYPDFSTNFGDADHNWTLNDADGEDTFGISGVDYEHYGEPAAFIVFNPANTTPPMTQTSVTPQDGDKYIMSISPQSGTNNDWLITPRIHCGNVTILSFYAKSFSSEYNNEKFELKFSVGGEEPTDFAYNVDNANPVFTVSNEWTLYNFNVSSLAAQTVVRFGLHCVSQDAFALMIDNFRIDGSDDIVDNEEVEEIIPQTTALKNNYPNPFNPETTISYDMPKSGHVKIAVYNIKGQKVKTIVNENVQAGTHTVVWNGKNENNSRVSSGIYFYRMTADSYSSTKKMILMK